MKKKAKQQKKDTSWYNFFPLYTIDSVCSNRTNTYKIIHLYSHAQITVESVCKTLHFLLCFYFMIRFFFFIQNIQEKHVLTIPEMRAAGGYVCRSCEANEHIQARNEICIRIHWENHEEITHVRWVRASPTHATRFWVESIDFIIVTMIILIFISIPMIIIAYFSSTIKLLDFSSDENSVCFISAETSKWNFSTFQTTFFCIDIWQTASDEDFTMQRYFKRKLKCLA